MDRASLGKTMDRASLGRPKSPLGLSLSPCRGQLGARVPPSISHHGNIHLVGDSATSGAGGVVASSWATHNTPSAGSNASGGLASTALPGVGRVSLSPMVQWSPQDKESLHRFADLSHRLPEPIPEEHPRDCLSARDLLSDDSHWRDEPLFLSQHPAPTTGLHGEQFLPNFGLDAATKSAALSQTLSSTAGLQLLREELRNAASEAADFQSVSAGQLAESVAAQSRLREELHASALEVFEVRASASERVLKHQVHVDECMLAVDAKTGEVESLRTDAVERGVAWAAERETLLEELYGSEIKLSSAQGCVAALEKEVAAQQAKSVTFCASSRDFCNDRTEAAHAETETLRKARAELAEFAQREEQMVLEWRRDMETMNQACADSNATNQAATLRIETLEREKDAAVDVARRARADATDKAEAVHCATMRAEVLERELNEVRLAAVSHNEHVARLESQAGSAAAEICRLNEELAQARDTNVTKCQQCQKQTSAFLLDKVKHQLDANDKRALNLRANFQLEGKQSLTAKVVAGLPTPQTKAFQPIRLGSNRSNQVAAWKPELGECNSNIACQQWGFDNQFRSRSQDADAEQGSTACPSVVQDVDRLSTAGRSISSQAATPSVVQDDSSQHGTVATASQAGSEGPVDIDDQHKFLGQLKEEISSLRQMYQASMHDVEIHETRAARRDHGETVRTAATAAAATAALMVSSGMRRGGNSEASLQQPSGQLPQPHASAPKQMQHVQPVQPAQPVQPVQAAQPLHSKCSTPQAPEAPLSRARSGSPRRSASPCRPTAAPRPVMGLLRSTSASLLPNATLVPAVATLARNQSVTVIGLGHVAVHRHGVSVRKLLPQQRG